MVGSDTCKQPLIGDSVSGLTLKPGRAVALLLAFALFGLGSPAEAATKIHNLVITPATLTFFAANPDSPFVPGNVSTTISFRTTGGTVSNTWQVEVQAAGGGNMINCPSSIPVSRIRVTCVTATVSGGTGACAAPFALSTGMQTVATGTEGPGNERPYTIVLNYTFEDSWRFIATNTPCSVNLTYRITAN